MRSPCAKMMTAQLEEHQRQQKTSIGAVMTVTATDRILQNSQVLQIAETHAGEAKLRRVAARTNHGSTTIREHRAGNPEPSHGRVTAAPPQFRSTVAASVFLQGVTMVWDVSFNCDICGKKKGDSNHWWMYVLGDVPVLRRGAARPAIHAAAVEFCREPESGHASSLRAGLRDAGPGAVHDESRPSSARPARSA